MRGAGVTATRCMPSGLARRLFWLGMFFVHGAALPSLWSILTSGSDLAVQPSALARFVGMSLAAAFFVLKIIDVPWLRLAPGWRTAVAAVVVVALLHVGVVDRALGGDLQLDASHLGLVLSAGTLCPIEYLKRLVGRNLVRALPVPSSRSGTLDLPLGRSPEPAFQPIRLFFIPSYQGSRAPPLA